MGILVTAAYAVQSKYHRTKQKSRGQLVFGREMILPIDNISNWRNTPQRKQTQIKKDAINKNSTIIDHY